MILRLLDKVSLLTTQAYPLSMKGSWIISNNELNYPRWHHTSWETSSGIYLIGGEYPGSEMTTEIVKDNDITEAGFSLKYPAM